MDWAFVSQTWGHLGVTYQNLSGVFSSLFLWPLKGSAFYMSVMECVARGLLFKAEYNGVECNGIQFVSGHFVFKNIDS